MARPVKGRSLAGPKAEYPARTVRAADLCQPGAGLLPLQAWDLNAWSAYWSHYNSLRVAKGLLWGLVFFGLYRSLPHREEAFKRLASGMALGVLGVSAWALWEQAQFAGTATTLDYRTTAGFSSMHTGGGHFEAYLVMSLPFVWGLSFMLRKPLQRALLAATFRRVPMPRPPPWRAAAPSRWVLRSPS